MTIYKVSHNSSSVEFASLEAAQTYCSAHSINEASIESENRSTPVDYVAVYQAKIEKAIKGFNSLMAEVASKNVVAGITQAGKTKLIADATADMLRYGQTGSLYEALAEADRITITAEMSPFLTENVRQEFKIKLQVLIDSL